MIDTTSVGTRSRGTSIAVHLVVCVALVGCAPPAPSIDAATTGDAGMIGPFFLVDPRLALLYTELDVR